MNEQTMINQEAKDHAFACTLFARLLGQWAPSFIRLPVLHKNLDKPTQCMALDNIKSPPTQVGCDQIAIALCSVVFDRHDKPFGVVGADVQPRTTDSRHHLLTTPDAEGLGCPRLGGTIVGDVLFALPNPNVLMAADLRDDVHATDNGRGSIDEGRRSIECICHETGHPDRGMVSRERFTQAQGEWFFRGILGIGPWVGRPLFFRDTWRLEGLFLLIPRTKYRSSWKGVQIC